MNENIITAIKQFSEYYPEYQIVSIMLWDQTKEYESYKVQGVKFDNQFIATIRINL